VVASTQRPGGRLAGRGRPLTGHAAGEAGVDLRRGPAASCPLMAGALKIWGGGAMSTNSSKSDASSAQGSSDFARHPGHSQVDHGCSVGWDWPRW
jgi:hypothetical protein